MKSINKCNTNGFTLVEVMVAIVIMAIGLIGITTLQINATNGNTDSSQKTIAANIAQNLTEELLTLAPDNALLNDSDGDGNGFTQDVDADGIDDDDDGDHLKEPDENFGLDDIVGSDFTRAHPTHQIFWNIANNIYGPNSIVISVIVTWGVGDSDLEKVTMTTIH